MPNRKKARVACCWLASACNSAPMAGKAGRYMSIDIGAKAVSDPSRKTSPQGVAVGRAMSGDWLKVGCV